MERGRWVLVGKPEGKRPLGIARRRWVYNIRMYLWGERVYWVFVVKPEGNRPLWTTRRKWVYNIRLDLWGEGSVYGLGVNTGGKETAGEM